MDQLYQLTLTIAKLRPDGHNWNFVKYVYFNLKY